MSGNSFLADTNIILYLLNGDKTLSKLLDGSNLYISFITELELYSFKHLTKSEKQKIEKVLSGINIIDITPTIKSLTIDIRQQYNVKLPDSIVAATSLFLGITLITADLGFKKIAPLDLVLYEK